MQARKQKTILFAIIAGLGIIMVVAVAWRYIRANKFLEYRHPDWNFTMVYPANWLRMENAHDVDVIFYSPKENPLDFFQENVNITVENIPEGVNTIEEYTERLLKEMHMTFGKYFELLESEEIFWGGQMGHKIVYLGKGIDIEFKLMHYFILVGDKAYQFTYGGIPNKFDKYLPKAEKMADSFVLGP